METQTLLEEFTQRWLAFDPETQECLLYLARAFVGDKRIDDLPNYQRALERQDREIAERYTTFGALEVGDRFTHFGREYQKTEIDQIPCFVNCQSDRGQTYMGDLYVVERVESQETLDQP
jgi:hypothetical protein